MPKSDYKLESLIQSWVFHPIMNHFKWQLIGSLLLKFQTKFYIRVHWYNKNIVNAIFRITFTSWSDSWRIDVYNKIFIYKNLALTLTLTTQENWLEYFALKFQNDKQFMYDSPWEMMHVLMLNSERCYQQSEFMMILNYY